MLRLTELSLPIDHPEEALRPAILKRLGLKDAELLDVLAYISSLDKP